MTDGWDAKFQKNLKRFIFAGSRYSANNIKQRFMIHWLNEDKV